jgi:hypothetical protein
VSDAYTYINDANEKYNKGMNININKNVLAINN